mgnify:CR=1 FL=1
MHPLVKCCIRTFNSQVLTLYRTHLPSCCTVGAIYSLKNLQRPPFLRFSIKIVIFQKKFSQTMRVTISRKSGPFIWATSASGVGRKPRAGLSFGPPFRRRNQRRRPPHRADYKYGNRGRFLSLHFTEKCEELSGGGGGGDEREVGGSRGRRSGGAIAGAGAGRENARRRRRHDVEREGQGGGCGGGLAVVEAGDEGGECGGGGGGWSESEEEGGGVAAGVHVHLLLGPKLLRPHPFPCPFSWALLVIFVFLISFFLPSSISMDQRCEYFCQRKKHVMWRFLVFSSPVLAWKYDVFHWQILQNSEPEFDVLELWRAFNFSNDKRSFKDLLFEIIDRLMAVSNVSRIYLSSETAAQVHMHKQKQNWTFFRALQTPLAWPACIHTFHQKF